MFKLQFASLEDVLSFMLDFSDVTGLTIRRNANDDSLVQTFIFNSEFENIDAKYWNKGIEEDCPNCADQASIAAPGETTLCKTHDNERHYKLMKDFFIEEIQRLQFKAKLPFCSCCGTDKKVRYVGMIPVYKTDQISTFSFCINCRDELTLKKNAVIAAQERIGA